MPTAPGTAVPPPSRYELGAEIARGGMGVVVRARDRNLNRDLAVKLVHAHLAGHPSVLRRFREEAEVLGRLQHPGVVPVHEVGTLLDGRPFFAMKLVAGRTLADLLRERHWGDLQLGRFLPVFEQVCQTVAFAHSRNFVHRDLKPGNVMVGEFGEVQVMDWGLAKPVLGGPGDEALADDRAGGGPADPDATVDHPASSMDDDRTTAGQVIGTPAYMPPEQARGEVGRVGPAADVFALGGILAEILTGRPPFTGTRDEVLEAARVGRLGPAWERVRGSGADPELVELAIRCLQPDPSARPRDAGVLAKLVTAYRTGVEERLKAAELERAAAQAKATEERRRRRAQFALVGVALLLAVAGGFGAWWGQRQLANQARAERDREQREATLREEKALQRQREKLVTEAALAQATELRKQALWKQAEAVVRQALDALSPDADPALREQLETARGHVRLAARLDAIRQDRRSQKGGVGEAYRLLLVENGIDIERGEEEALARLVASHPLRDELVAVMDDWAASEENWGGRNEAKLLAVTALATGQAWRRDLAAAWKDAIVDNKPLLAFLEQADLGQMPPTLIAGVAGKVSGIWKDPDKPETILGIKLIQQAIDRNPSDYDLHREMIDVLARGTRPGESGQRIIGHYRAALAIRPGSADDWIGLGQALWGAGEREEAVRAYRAALSLRPGDWFHWRRLGELLWDVGDRRGAAQAFREVVQRDPGRAQGFFQLGLALVLSGDREGALEAFRTALGLERGDAATHFLSDGDGFWGRGGFFGRVAWGWRARGEAVSVFREAASASPKAATTFGNLGRLLWARGDRAAAIQCFRDQVTATAAGRVAAAEEKRPVLRALQNAAWVRGDPDGAVTDFRELVRISPEFLDEFLKLGLRFRDWGDLDRAATVLREVSRVAPSNPWGHGNLGWVLHLKGDHAGGAAAYREAIRLDPESAKFHWELGIVLWAKGDRGEAIAMFRKATELDPRAAEPQFRLGIALREQGDIEGATAGFKEAIRLDPMFATAHNNLGVMLQAKGDFGGAVARYQEAVRLAQSTGHRELQLFRNNLRRAERYQELLPRLTEIAAERAEPGNPAEACELAALCTQPFQKRYALAVRLYAGAFDADPGLARNLDAYNRYNAACCAALAAAGKDAELTAFGVEEWGQLTDRAYRWLRADLAAWGTRARDSKAWPAVGRQMLHWKQDADLAAVRDPAWLAAMPPADRARWESLWADADALLAGVTQPPKE